MNAKKASGDLGLLLEAAARIETYRHECRYCQRRFSQKSNCTRHERIHRDERRFECATCGSRFVLKKNMADHVRTHTGERPYRCEACERRFSRESSLVRHARIHSGEKPFVCVHCHKEFAWRTYLSRHFKSAHESALKAQRKRPEAKADFEPDWAEPRPPAAEPPTAKPAAAQELEDMIAGRRKNIMRPVKGSLIEVTGAVKKLVEIDHREKNVRPQTAKKSKTFSVTVPRIGSSTAGKVGEYYMRMTDEQKKNYYKRILRVKIHRFDAKEADSD